MPAVTSDRLNDEVRDRLEKMTNVSSVPLVIAQVLRVSGDSEESVEHLANAVESDHALTSRLLRVANSAFYGMSEDIYTVRDAIVLIGFDAVQSLAISAEVVSGVWAADELFNAKQIWGHSLSCGLFAEAYARKIGSVKPEVAFTLGILHDIGRVIIIQCAPELYRKAIEKMKTERSYLWRAEEEVMGFHHGEVGAQLVTNWKLPHAYSEAIGLHHEPFKAEHEIELTYLISLANATTHQAFPVDIGGRTSLPLTKSLWEPIGLTEDDVRQVLQQKNEVRFRAETFFNTAQKL